MSKYKIYAKYTVTMEKESLEIEADNEIDAITKAHDEEEKIIEDLKKECNETVIFEEFVAVKIKE